MHPVKIRVKKRRTVVAFVLALGVGLPPPAQGYLLDFTVASISPGVLISHAGGSPSRPPPAGSTLKVVDVNHIGDPGSQSSPTIPPPKKILDFPREPWADSFSNVCSASYVWMFGGVSPQGSIPLQSLISCLNMSGGTALLRGSFGTDRVTETAPTRGNSLGYVAGSNFTADKTDALLASLGIPRQTVEDNFNPDFAASFSSVPNAFASTRVPSSNILHRIAPFSFTLMLLGGGLMGLVGLRYRRRRG